jgi:hypothetical protein
MATSYKPKKKAATKDDLLFKELSIEIIPGIIQKSNCEFRKVIFLFKQV